MEDSAEVKNREILDRAKREAADILKEADERAQAKSEQLVQTSRRSAEVERNRLVYLTHEEVKGRISKVRKDLYLKAFSLAGERLSAFRDSDDYPVFFKKMLQEAISQVGTEQLVLHVDSRDADLSRELIKKEKIQASISPDIVTAGGLSVSSDNGSVFAHNTIESRLEKAKELLSLDLSAELTGG